MVKHFHLTLKNLALSTALLLNHNNKQRLKILPKISPFSQIAHLRGNTEVW